MYGARQASSVSVYAVIEPVTTHAASGQARPITPLNTATDADSTRSRGGNGSLARVIQRCATCRARASAKARPLGRVSAITAITGNSARYRRSSRR
jgi:hypothetical protein